MSNRKNIEAVVETTLNGVPAHTLRHSASELKKWLHESGSTINTLKNGPQQWTNLISLVRLRLWLISNKAAGLSVAVAIDCSS
jgi:tartrate dehydratase alpha subunit/fumarate hydratase class I-like protein